MAQFHLLSSYLGDIARYGGGLHVSAGVGIGHAIREPQIAVGPLYAAKTIDLCADGDTICNGAPPGPPNGAHGSYGANGMVNQAAVFAVKRL